MTSTTPAPGRPAALPDQGQLPPPSRQAAHARHGRWVRLVPLTPEHYGFVHLLASQDPIAFHPLFPDGIPDVDAFPERLSAAVATCFVVVGTQRHQPVGVAYLYQWSGQHEVAHFQVVMIPARRGTGIGAEAAYLFVAHVFRSFNIRKLYVTVPAWRRPAIASAVGILLQEEGRLRDHRYFSGAFHDEWILAVRRDRFAELASGGLRGLRAPRAVTTAPTTPRMPTVPAPEPLAPSTPSPRWHSLADRNPGLVGAHLHLVPAGREHVKYLYELATSAEIGHRWRFGGAVPTLQEFWRLFDQGVFCQFVAVLRRTGQPVGHVVAYQADLANGHVYVGGAIEPRLHRTGLPLEAFVVLIRHLFTNWNFRKVYMDLPEYNRDQLFAAGPATGAREEARLRDVTYHDGQWWDRSTIALTRDVFCSALGLPSG